MTRPTTMLQLRRQASGPRSTTYLVFDGARPSDKNIADIFTTAFKDSKIFEIETIDGFNVTICHSSTLTAEELRQQISDILVSLGTGLETNVKISPRNRATRIGAMVMRLLTGN